MTTIPQPPPAWWRDGAAAVLRAARELGAALQVEPGELPRELETRTDVSLLLLTLEPWETRFVRVDNPELADLLDTIREDCRRLLGALP